MGRTGRALRVAAVLLAAVGGASGGWAEESRGAPDAASRNAAVEVRSLELPALPQAWIHLERWLWGDDALERFVDEAGDLSWEPPPLTLRFPGVRTTSSYREKPRAGGGRWPDGGLLLDLSASAITRLWTGTVTADTHVKALQSGSPLTTEEHADAPWFARFRLAGRWDWLGAGLQVHTATPGLELPRPGLPTDEDRTEAWLETRLGSARLKTYVAQTADNAVEDRRRWQTTRNAAGVSLGVPLLGGSLLTLGYEHGLAEQSPPPIRREAPATRTRRVDKLYASFFYYGGPTWDATLSASATPSQDASGGQEVLASSYDLTFSYRPIDRLSFTSSLGLSDEEYRWEGKRTQNVYGTLSLWYALRRHLDATVNGTYTRSYLSDGLYDEQTLTAAGGLVWHLRREGPRTSLAVDVGYTRYLETASAVGYEDVYGLIALRIAGF